MIRIHTPSFEVREMLRMLFVDSLVRLAVELVSFCASCNGRRAMHQQCQGPTMGRFTALSEGGPSLSRCGTLCSAAQCCIASHSATAWVPKSGIADVRREPRESVNC